VSAAIALRARQGSQAGSAGARVAASHLEEVPGVGHCYPEIHDLKAVIPLSPWTELWGPEFAAGQARRESALSERYRAGWAWALPLGEAERAARIATIGSCAVERPGRRQGGRVICSRPTAPAVAGR
jgi:hypothetical protein